MYDLYATLPWQHKLLFWETIVSAGIGVWLASRTFRRTKITMCWFLAWNLVLYALLISGAHHFAWQYVAIFLWYTVDSMVVIHFHSRGKTTRPEDYGVGLAFSAACIATILLALIITGN